MAGWQMGRQQPLAASWTQLRQAAFGCRWQALRVRWLAGWLLQLLLLRGQPGERSPWRAAPGKQPAEAEADGQLVAKASPSWAQHVVEMVPRHQCCRGGCWGGQRRRSAVGRGGEGQQFGRRGRSGRAGGTCRGSACHARVEG